MSSAGPDGQHGSLDPIPVEPVDCKDTPGVEKFAVSMPVDERHKLAGNNFVEIEDENVLRPHAAQGERLHARHVVDVDLQRGLAAECRDVAGQRLAPGMLVEPAANAVSPGREETVERSVNVRAFGFHRGPVERTDIVEVDIVRESVETEMEEVERRPALEGETIRQNPIPRDLLQQVQQTQHLLQRAGLVTGLVCGRCRVWAVGTAIYSPSKRRSRTSTGRMTFQPLAVLPLPDLVPRAYRG